MSLKGAIFMSNFPEWVASPVMRMIGLYIVTLFGALAMYVFALHKGFEGASAFLRKMFPSRSEVFYDRADFLLVTLSGSVIGWIIFAPNNAFQALAAGFGWVGAINILITQGETGVAAKAKVELSALERSGK